MFFQKKILSILTLKFPQKIFFGHVFPKKRFQLKFLGTGEIFFWHFFIFWVFFGVVNIGIRSKMAIFGKKPCTTTFTHFFFEPLFVDLLDAQAHFLCFLKKVSFMGGDQKKVFFFTFFFFFSKNPQIYSFLPMRSTF